MACKTWNFVRRMKPSRIFFFTWLSPFLNPQDLRWILLLNLVGVLLLQIAIRPNKNIIILCRIWTYKNRFWRSTLYRTERVLSYHSRYTVKKKVLFELKILKWKRFCMPNLINLMDLACHLFLLLELVFFNYKKSSSGCGLVSKKGHKELVLWITEASR